MRRIWQFGLLLASAASMWAQTPPAPLKRTVSTSRQFVVYHPDNLVRYRLARAAEDAKREWLAAFRLEDEWKSPIVLQVVMVRPPGTPRIRTGLFESDGQELKVQIDVFDPSVLKSADFPIEIYRALFLEYAHRKVPPKAGKAFPQPPAWLVEGLYENVVARDEGIPAGLYEKLVTDGPPPKLEAFLKERPETMDATSRAVYRAKAMALLRAFLQMPDGPKHLAEYLAELHSANPQDAGKLREKFPALADQPANLSKMWALCLADASATNRAKPLSMDDTMKQLALIFEMSAPKDPKRPEGGLISGPEALQAAARTDAGRYIAGQKAEDLIRLEVRAHPVLRPIVEEYRIIATLLARSPKKNLEKRIRKNMELADALSKRTGEIADYMNWFEAVRLDTPSREFDDSYDVEERSAALRRTDAVSRTLDDIAARGW
ncbi:MAG TPA: hypothetical protein PLS03_17215 [Terrimicrobiaceae bacterium]|nr:hypothetical protein [Terrimicrobiaceae bacterium]